MITSKRFLIKNFSIKELTTGYLSWFFNKNNKFIIYKKKNIRQLKIYILKNIFKKNTFFFAIKDKNTHAHIGNIKFEVDKIFSKMLVVGILIGDENFQGKGVFPEIMEKACIFFKKKGFSNICATIDINNVNSIKSFRRSGFKFLSKNTKQIKVIKFI